MSIPMTRGHYEFLAETLQDIHASEIVTDEQYTAIVERFADYLRSTNSGFNTARFERACQPGANVRART